MNIFFNVRIIFFARISFFADLPKEVAAPLLSDNVVTPPSTRDIAKVTLEPEKSKRPRGNKLDLYLVKLKITFKKLKLMHQNKAALIFFN